MAASFGPTAKILSAGWLKKSSVKGNRNTDFKERFCVLLSEGSGPDSRSSILYFDKPWQVLWMKPCR